MSFEELLGEKILIGNEELVALPTIFTAF